MFDALFDVFRFFGNYFGILDKKQVLINDRRMSQRKRDSFIVKRGVIRKKIIVIPALDSHTTKKTEKKGSNHGLNQNTQRFFDFVLLFML
jgi:hypothetical protein